MSGLAHGRRNASGREPNRVASLDGGMATIEDAARLALGLPGATEAIRHGNRTWFVAGKAFAWERPFSKADVKRFGDATPPAGPILAVRVLDLHDKEAVLHTHRRSFFTIPHFDGYAAVLIKLKAVTPKALKEAIVDAWLVCAPAAAATRFLSASRPKRSRT